MSANWKDATFSEKSTRNRLLWRERKPSGRDQCLPNSSKTDQESLNHRFRGACRIIPVNFLFFFKKNHTLERGARMKKLILIVLGVWLSLCTAAHGYSIFCWGPSNPSRPLDPVYVQSPAGDDFIAIDAGLTHSLALREDGSIVAWGKSSFNVLNVPTGNGFIAIDAGWAHDLALRSDGSIVAWGVAENPSILEVPSGNDFLKVSAGYRHNLALKNDGSMVAWGKDYDGSAIAPFGNNFVDVAAGHGLSAALMDDGNILLWGPGYASPTILTPPVAVTEIDMWRHLGIGLGEDGSFFTWGKKQFYGNEVIIHGEGKIIAVDSGELFRLVLMEDGTIEGCRSNPIGDNFVAVAAGRRWGVALYDGETPLPPAPIVPIPASFLLLGSGLAGLGFIRGRLRKK
jgi:alpha-tubulin suppressor-like RCC1 family protein